MSAPSANRIKTKALLSTAVFTAFGVGIAAPAAAQSCTPPLLGVVTCPGDDNSIVVDLTTGADDLVVELGEDFETLTTVSVTSLLGGDITIDTLSSAVIETVDEPGLLVDSTGAIDAQITSITTEGDGATGALLRAVDDVIFVADDTISTTGDLADGINIEGSSVSVTSNAVRTEGEDSDGVELVALDGPLSLDADTIETEGGLSSATILRAAGDIDANVGVLRTGGDQALGADISSDAAACVLLGQNGCDVTFAADEITTEGFGSIGALVSAAGDTDIAIDVLQTSGDQAAGLDLSADPAACVALGVGACDTAFTVNELTTNGASAPGAIVRAVGDIDANVGVLTTNGDDAVGLDLGSDPAACAILGAGACDTSFSVGELTTSGAGATGVLVRAAGDTTGNVGVLETMGDDSPGIDIAADPVACVLIGAGACDVGLVADSVTTQGSGAAAVLINAPGEVLADLGLISTSGDNATGVGIVTDPAVCLVLGPGACRVEADVDGIDTDGDNSAGVDVDSPGPIVVDTGDIDTDGDNSPGVDVDGGEGPIDIDTGDIDTDGDNSPGIIVDGTGPIDVDAGDIVTGGDNSDGVNVDGDDDPIMVDVGTVTTGADDSDGIDVTGDGPITVGVGTVNTGGDDSDGVVVAGGEGPIVVNFDEIVTTGDDSDGVDVTGTGTIDINGGTVTTSGDGSDGVVVVGDDDAVTVNTDEIMTSGAGSDGIDVTTTSGDQTITAGPVTVTGEGSNGITGVATGCASIDITATGPISSASGTGIAASSACDVSVTTLAGASVTGADAGIDVTSGTGATILIGDSVSSSDGPAINVDGAAADVTVGAGGTIEGFIDLTDEDDTLTNAGTFNAEGDSDFGGSSDMLVNTGVIAVLPDATAAGDVTFTGLEAVMNSGGIDMRNGHTGDSLTLTGDYIGSGGAYLGVDVRPGTGGGTADQLVIGGAATGTTTVMIDELDGSPGTLVNNAVIVDAGAGTSAGAFVLPGGSTVSSGFIDYDLTFDAASNDFALFGTPNGRAYQQALLMDGSRQTFYRSNDAVSAHLSDTAAASAAGDESTRSSALWMVSFGQVTHRDLSQDFAAFGRTTTAPLDYEQDMFGIQIGYDFGDVAGSGSMFGVTGGYTNSVLRFTDTGDRFGYSAVNAGVYGQLASSNFFVNGIARYEKGWIDVVGRSAGFRGDLDADSWGGKLEAGARFGSTFYLQPSVSVEYVRTSLDDLTALNTSFAFADGEGLRGKAGVRIGSTIGDGPNALQLYAAGYAVHEFGREDSFSLTNGGTTLNFDSPRIGTYAQLRAGFSAQMADRVSGFIEGTGEIGKDYDGVGARAGLSIRF